MKVFDLYKMAAFPYEQREKNVFYQTGEFKMRVIDLPPGGNIPVCEMASHVIFYVMDGEADVTVNLESMVLKEKQCLVTEPATLSMKTKGGARLLGIQIEAISEVKDGKE